MLVVSFCEIKKSIRATRYNDLDIILHFRKKNIEQVHLYKNLN